MAEPSNNSSLPPRYYGPHQVQKERILDELKQVVLALNALIEEGENQLKDDPNKGLHLSNFWMGITMLLMQLPAIELPK